MKNENLVNKKMMTGIDDGFYGGREDWRRTELAQDHGPISSICITGFQLVVQLLQQSVS
jgi:hypothetical protein